jgi:hypothetical protein
MHWRINLEVVNGFDTMKLMTTQQVNQSIHFAVQRARNRTVPISSILFGISMPRHAF